MRAWVSGRILEYYPGYKPENPAAYEEASEFLERTASLGGRKSFDGAMMILLMDMRIPRQDLMVALERVARAKGWKL